MWKNVARSVLKQKSAVKAAPVAQATPVAASSGFDNVFTVGSWDSASTAVFTPDIGEVTYFTVLRILSETMGKLPVYLRDKQHKIVDNDVNSVLSIRPNGKDTPASLFSYLERCRNHYGNGYAYVKWNQKTGKLDGIVPLDPRRVQIWVDNVTDIIDVKHYYQYQSLSGQSYMISPDDIIHVRNWHTDDRTGLVGIPVRQTLIEYMSAAKAGQATQNDMYQNGMIANAVLNYVGDIDETRKQKMVESIKKLGKASKILPLPVGWEVKPLNLSLADSQYLETRKFTAAQLAAAFGVSPTQLNDYSKGSYANATAQQLSFLQSTLSYIATVYEQELTLKLLSDADIKRGLRVDIDTDAMLQNTPDILATMVRNLAGGSVMKINEARDKLGLPPIDGGDVLVTTPGAGTVDNITNRITKDGE